MSICPILANAEHFISTLRHHAVTSYNTARRASAYWKKGERTGKASGKAY